MESLQRDFDAKTKQWQKTTCRKQLLKQIDWAVDAREKKMMFRRYICIGTGSLSRDNVECQRRSMWQTVVFLDVVRYMLDSCEGGDGEEGNGGKLESEDDDDDDNTTTTTSGIWASDPAYTELDVAFFQTKGVEVLPFEKSETGLGKKTTSRLPDSTLLYEPFVDMNASMLRDIIQNEIEIYIGSSVGGLQERQGEVGELARQFCVGRTMRKFPTFECDPNVFDGMGIYWKENVD